MRGKVFYGFLILFLVGCNEAPVKYKEINYPVSKNNIKEYCIELEKFFPDYSCKQYFKKSFEIKESEESITIELNKKKLNLIYKSKTGKNQDLFKLYTNLNEAL